MLVQTTDLVFFFSVHTLFRWKRRKKMRESKDVINVYGNVMFEIAIIIHICCVTTVKLNICSYGSIFVRFDKKISKKIKI